MSQRSEIESALEAAEDARAQAKGLRALARQESTVKELKGMLTAAAADLEEIEEASQVKAWFDSVASKPISIKTRKRIQKPAVTFVAAASDWHSAQIVNSASVGGLNEHDQAIGQERAERFARHLVRLVEHQQGAFQIDDLVLWLGGDFMVGEIHGVDSARSCNLTPLEELAFCHDILSGVIAHLLAKLDVPRIRIMCCWGNHGRTTEKPRSHRVHAYSYEQFLYTSLAREFRDEKRITWDVGANSFKIADIAGFRLVAHHGDQRVVTGGGGIGGLAVPFRRRALTSILPTHQANHFLIGHFHQALTLDVCSCNGSLVGVDEYAYGLGLRAERPTQIAFLVDHERQRIGTVMPLWCDK